MMSFTAFTSLLVVLAPVLFVAGTFLFRRGRRGGDAGPRTHSGVRRGRGYDLGAFIRNGGLGSPGRGGQGGDRVVIPGDGDDHDAR